MELNRKMIVLLLFMSISCNEKNENELSSSAAHLPDAEDVVSVQTLRIEPKVFVARTVSNGKVSSTQEIPLNFYEAGVIEKVYVRNGSTVKEGQILGSLVNASQKILVHEAELQLDEATVELNDLLITQGGKHGDSTSVSPDVYAYIRIRSGYNRALLTLQKARLALANTFLFAPFSGTIANLTATSHSPTATDKPFCTLLDRRNILVHCSIIETELRDVHLGQTAKIVPVGFPSLTYAGRVVEINPMVNAQGLIDVVVQVVNPTTQILSGMNVRIMIENRVGSQLAVPKNAIVDRGSRKVVFTFENGMAKWCYVVTGEENDKEIVVAEGLKSGDQVIVSGNVNLAHDVKVKRE